MSHTLIDLFQHYTVHRAFEKSLRQVVTYVKLDLINELNNYWISQINNVKNMKNVHFLNCSFSERANVEKNKSMFCVA